jgi:hypothetical protein
MFSLESVKEQGICVQFCFNITTVKPTTSCMKHMAMMPWVKQWPTNGLIFLSGRTTKYGDDDHDDHGAYVSSQVDLQLQELNLSACSGEKHYSWKSSADCPRSFKIGRIVWWFRTLDWWSEIAISTCEYLLKCHYWWQDVSLANNSHHNKRVLLWPAPRKHNRHTHK